MSGRKGIVPAQQAEMAPAPVFFTEMGGLYETAAFGGFAHWQTG